jgi:dTMP kinase
MAYQGGGRHLGVDEILTINTFATEGRLPDLTLLFDLSPEVGLARIAKNKNREVNRLDLEELNFHRQVRQTYLELAQRWPHRYEIINAEKSFLEVCECAYQIIIRHLKDNS